MSDINMSELSKLAEEAIALEEKIKPLAEQKDALERQKSAILGKINVALEALGMKNLDLHGKKFIRAEELSVSMPQEQEDRKQFFAWLKEKDPDMTLLSVHGQTLKSQYKQWLEEANAAGVPLEVPGLAEPRFTSYTYMKSKK